MPNTVPLLAPSIIHSLSGGSKFKKGYELIELSQPALAFRSRIEDEGEFLQTCEGGDPGTPESPSVWLVGIEPGWSTIDEEADRDDRDDHAANLAEYSVDLQLGWPFNRNAFKLLSALKGGTPDAYRSFAMIARPFERGSVGYFKANLFPEPFNKIGAWDEATALKTGFATKDDYRSWLKENRFRVMKTWIERCRPRLVIGCGLTHLDDFLEITGTPVMPPAHRFTVNGHPKRMYVATTGTVPVTIVPHLSGGAHGLNSNDAIAMAAERIRTELSL